MSAGFVGPLAIFWMQAWGPLRPWDTDAAPAPSWPMFLAGVAASVALWCLPRGWYRIRRVERDGAIYVPLGVRQFRRFVTDGDLVNRARRRTAPGYRKVHGRRSVQAYLSYTRDAERGHLVWLVAGALSAWWAMRIGWSGWAVFITVGNVLVNLGPILLQRHTRGRVLRMLQSSRDARHSRDTRAARTTDATTATFPE